MKHILSFLLMCTSLFCYAQIKKTIDPIGDTVSTYAITAATNFEISDLKLSVYKQHYCFRTTGQAVEIWSADGVTFSGTLINYIYKYKKGLISKKSNISSLDAKRVIDIYNSLDISLIPTDKKIDDYNFGFDGGVNTIEHATLDSYSHKQYWTPEAQTGKRGVVIKDFFMQLSTTLSLHKRYNDFFNELPIGKYQIGMVIWEKSSRMRRKGGSIWDQ